MAQVPGAQWCFEQWKVFILILRLELLCLQNGKDNIRPCPNSSLIPEAPTTTWHPQLEEVKFDFDSQFLKVQAIVSWPQGRRVQQRAWWWRKSPWCSSRKQRDGSQEQGRDTNSRAASAVTHLPTSRLAITPHLNLYWGSCEVSCSY